MTSATPPTSHALPGRIRAAPPSVLLLWALCLAGCGQAPVSVAQSSSQCVPNQCQIAGSLKSDGTCVFVNKADGTGCDDNNSCTLFDTCKAGVCLGGTVLKDGATCDDKNVCTQTDICQGGVCVGTNPLICPAGDACHQGGVCDPIKGCTLISYGPCVTGLASLSVDGCVQSDYFTAMLLGGQPFTLLIDSGSTTTAVATAQCANCQVTPTYTPGSNAVDQQHQAQGAYGDSTGWLGKVYLDVAQAGTSAAPVTPAVALRFAAITQDTNPQQPFFSGSTCTGSANTSAYQGILGLGPTDLALNYTDSLLDKVAASAKLTYDAFAVSLCDVGGQMWFGGFNPTAVSQAPQFSPMVTKDVEGDYYSVAIDDLLVGSTSVGLASDALGPAVMDTGTGGYTMSQAAFDATTALITANSAFLTHFPKTFFSDNLCVTSLKGSDAATVDTALPSLTLALPSGGKLGSLQVTMSATKSYLQPQQNGSQVRFCSTITPSSSTIWGSAFMRSQVVIFDRENGQIGFAPQTGCSSNLPSAVTSQ